MDFSIIPTVKAHIDDIVKIENRVFTIPWSKDALLEEVTRNRFAVYFSAVMENQVVGYIGMWKIFDEGHITNLAVHPGYQNKGIGKALLKHLIDYSASHGITKMTLEVRESNIKAIRLYRSFGFRNVGIRKKYYSDNNEDALIMWKEDIQPR